MEEKMVKLVINKKDAYLFIDGARVDTYTSDEVKFAKSMLKTLYARDAIAGLEIEQKDN